MPSSLKQKGIILTGTNKKTGKTTYILVAQRTGYINVTINGQVFYYNKMASYPMTTKNVVDKTVQSNTTSTKKTIIISRKN